MTAFFRRIGPYAFEGIRTSGIMAVGDVLAQTAVEHRDIKDVDWKRTVRYSSLGFLLIGPTLRGWYKLLDKRVSAKQPKMQRGLKKVVFDQAMFAPVFNVVVMAAFGIVNGQDAGTIKRRIQNDYLQVMKYNMMIWPATQVINLSFTPLQYQVVVASFIAIVWNIILSKLLNAEMEQKEIGN